MRLNWWLRTSAAAMYQTTNDSAIPAHPPNTIAASVPVASPMMSGMRVTSTSMNAIVMATLVRSDPISIYRLKMAQGTKNSAVTQCHVA